MAIEKEGKETKDKPSIEATVNGPTW